MRINLITCNNFKSLVDFRLALANFTCLIGLNGSGKSTVLQFIDFVARQMHGNVKGWLEERHWKANELHSHFSARKNIQFGIHMMSDAEQGTVAWDARFNPVRLHCSPEK